MAGDIACRLNVNSVPMATQRISPCTYSICRLYWIVNGNYCKKISMDVYLELYTFFHYGILSIIMQYGEYYWQPMPPLPCASAPSDGAFVSVEV